MKFLFKLIWGIIGFVVILAVAAVIVFAISTDNSKVTFDLTKQYRSFDTIIGDDTYNSLNKIKESNYKVEDNNITIAISDEEINYYVITMIRSFVNENYLDTDENIVKTDKAELKGIIFTIKDDTISLKLRAKLSFYDTSVNVGASLSIDNKMLIFKLENTKLGSLPVPIDFIKSVMSNLNVKLEGDTGFDPSTFEFKLNLESLLKSATNNEMLSIILNNCDYLVTVSESKLKVILKTNKIFLPSQVVPEGDGTGFNEKFSNSLEDAINDPNHQFTCTISEENFNDKIKQYIDDSTSNFSFSFKIGNKDFTLGLTNAYYSIEKNAIITNLSLNDVTTPINFGINFNKTVVDGVIKSINFEVKSISIGELVGIDFDSIQFDEIPVSTLEFYNIKIKDIVFNQTDKTVTVSGIYG